MSTQLTNQKKRKAFERAIRELEALVELQRLTAALEVAATFEVA